MFKKLLKKAGNVLLPVIGTIAALSILASSCVAFALNSNKIVYRQKNNPSDSRNVLYIATRYFSDELNIGTDPAVAKAILKDNFEFLEITRGQADSSGKYDYYLWYPVDEKARETAGSADGYTGLWYKATVKYSKTSDSDGNHGDQGINSTLFKKDAKLDELYAIGNMATVYLADEGLLPGRQYEVTEISLVESDIDTFDEAFTYMNNTGVIEVDNIITALYGYAASGDSFVTYTNNGTTTDYSIVYETGNIGGNYYWQTNNGSTITSNKTWIYRQEYDLPLLRDMMEYIYNRDTGDIYRFYYNKVGSAGNNAPNKNADYTMSYEYIDSLDAHIITFYGYIKNVEIKGNSFSKVYYSTRDFAEDLADYIFWSNLPRLALQMEDFVEAFQKDLCASSDFKSHSGGGGVESVYKFEYTWNNDGTLNVNTYWKSNPSNYWYFTKTITDIERVLKSIGYDTNQKIYDALTVKVKEEAIANIALEQIGTITASNIRDKVTNVHNIWNITNQVTMQYKYKDWLGREQSKNLNYTTKYSTDKMAKAIADYVGKTVYDKYITGNKKIGANAWSSGETVADMNTDASKLFADFQFQMDGNRIKISFHFFVVLSRNNGELRNYYSDETGDTIYLTVDEFVKTFPVEVAWCFGKTIDVNNETIKVVEEKARQQLMDDLVIPIGYQYQPISKLNEILGKNTSQILGLKEEAIYTNLLTYYLDKESNKFKNTIGENNYSIVITSASYSNELFRNHLILNLSYKIQVDGRAEALTDTVSFYIDYMTYSYHNTETLNKTNSEFYDNANNNYYTLTDKDGSTKSFFNLVKIENIEAGTLTANDIASNQTNAIITCIPYREREKLVNYKLDKVNISGVNYKQTTNLNDLKIVTENLLYNGTIENLGSSDFTITIKSGQSLFINGDLFLKDNQKVNIESDGLLFVNGNLVVFYEYNGYGSDGRTIPSDRAGRENLTSADIKWYKTRGVDIKATGDSKIMINGNLDYRGYKARYSTNNGMIQSMTGYSSTQLDGVMFQQDVFAHNVNCTLKDTGRWAHNTDEARSILSGVYIVNGDVKFRAWDELNTSNSHGSVEKYYLYRNTYSNPLINATFYVDGTFDMRGLYTSSLYDPCRANFVFAKSIVQPAIALNLVLRHGSGNSDQYGAWQNTDGYLFMIVEEAIDFSKVNFASVNLFTPYQQLVAAINANKVSETNFSKFIELETFKTMYPVIAVVDDWGLPSILRQGFKMAYANANNGANFDTKDRITGDDNW